MCQGSARYESTKRFMTETTLTIETALEGLLRRIVREEITALKTDCDEERLLSAEEPAQLLSVSASLKKLGGRHVERRFTKGRPLREAGRCFIRCRRARPILARSVRGVVVRMCRPRRGLSGY